MKIDDLLIHAGRRYIVRGFSDMAVIPPFAFLEDVETEEVLRVPVGALGPERRKRPRRARNPPAAD